MEQGEAATEPGQKSVLVVEDDCEIRRLMAMLIELEVGVAVREAADGAEALILIAEETPGLVVTDMRMPRVDGLELVRRLRRSPATRRVPVLVVTAAEVTPREILAAGADDCVPKPFDLEVLIAKICSHLGRG